MTGSLAASYTNGFCLQYISHLGSLLDSPCVNPHALPSSRMLLQSRGCYSVRSSQRSHRIWRHQHWVLHDPCFSKRIFKVPPTVIFSPVFSSTHQCSEFNVLICKKPFISLMFILISFIIYLAQ